MKSCQKVAEQLVESPNRAWRDNVVRSLLRLHLTLPTYIFCPPTFKEQLKKHHEAKSSELPSYALSDHKSIPHTPNIVKDILGNLIRGMRSPGGYVLGLEYNGTPMFQKLRRL